MSVEVSVYQGLLERSLSSASLGSPFAGHLKHGGKCKKSRQALLKAMHALIGIVNAQVNKKGVKKVTIAIASQGVILPLALPHITFFAVLRVSDRDPLAYISRIPHEECI